MEIILLERIERLGQMGDVVNVKPGYARNFLLPQKKALRATPENKARFELRRGQLEADSLERRQEVEAVAGRLDGFNVTLIRQAGESGQLYGSVTARDVATAVTEGGFTIARSQITMDRAIKMLGLHPIRVVLHPEVTVTVTANVAKSDEEAALQLERGGAVTAAELDAEEEAADAMVAADAALALADDRSAEAEAADGLVDDDVANRLESEASGDAEADGSGDADDAPAADAASGANDDPA